MVRQHFRLLLRIPDLVKNKYIGSHPKQIASLEQALESEKSITRALAGSVESVASGGETTGTGTISRTLASPDFEGCTVPDFYKQANWAAKTFDDFAAGKTSLRSVIKQFHSTIFLAQKMSLS